MRVLLAVTSLLWYSQVSLSPANAFFRGTTKQKDTLPSSPYRQWARWDIRTPTARLPDHVGDAGGPGYRRWAFMDAFVTPAGLFVVGTAYTAVTPDWNRWSVSIVPDEAEPIPHQPFRSVSLRDDYEAVWVAYRPLATEEAARLQHKDAVPASIHCMYEINDPARTGCQNATDLSLDIVRSSAQARSSGEKEHVAMCALTGNSVQQLMPWLLYWSSLGVTHFYIYYTFDEATKNALLVAAKSVQASLTMIEFGMDYWVPVKARPHHSQLAHQNSCYRRYMHLHQYMLFYDTDEYLVPAEAIPEIVTSNASCFQSPSPDEFNRNHKLRGYLDTVFSRESLSTSERPVALRTWSAWAVLGAPGRSVNSLTWEGLRTFPFHRTSVENRRPKLVLRTDFGAAEGPEPRLLMTPHTVMKPPGDPVQFTDVLPPGVASPVPVYRYKQYASHMHDAETGSFYHLHLAYGRSREGYVPVNDPPADSFVCNWVRFTQQDGAHTQV